MPERDRLKTLLAMVGLPARGKSYIGRKIARYLSWLGFKTRVFNMGNYRRAQFGSRQPADFFNPDNATGKQALHDLAMRALSDTLQWLDEGGEVGIYDATNTTRARRRFIEARCKQNDVSLIFVESICNDPAVIEANVRETKLSMPDYAGMDAEAAMADFRARIAHYEKAYQPLGESDGRYIKIIDVGEEVVLHRMYGYILGRVVPLVINLHIAPRPIWLTRHGESAYNVLGLIGGDSDLSPKGLEYAQHLADFIRTRAPEGASVRVWTSALKRTIQTAQPITKTPEIYRAFDEIDAGICDGMTYEQIRETMPDVYHARRNDKFRYRYPRGESYEDVIQRLDPMIIKLERQRSPVLLIGHQAVLRAVYAYMMDRPPSECPRLEIPLHSVIELTPTAYGCREERFALPPFLESDPEKERPSNRL